MTPRRATLAGVSLGDGLPVAVMGVLNVSPESFHAGSIRATDRGLLDAARAMAEAGAALLDVGARSTAPYLDTEVDEAEECDRLARAVELLAGEVPLPISADTARPGPARAALEAGARIINDVSGLRHPEVAALVEKHGAGVILMASPDRPEAPGGSGSTTRHARAWPVAAGLHQGASRLRVTGQERVSPPPPAAPGDPVERVKALLIEALGRARAAGIPEDRIVVDPGIGFFRDESARWDEWDCAVLAGLAALGLLGRPLCVGVSLKSFVGAITGRRRTDERLAGSLAATAVAVWNGAALIRAHDVIATVDAVRVAERLRSVAGLYNMGGQ